MNLFDNILINILLITIPFCFYFLYLIYTKTLQKEKNDLFLTFSIISSFYFILKMEQSDYIIITYVIINIPLLVSYMYHKKTTIFILSILFSYYYMYNFEINIFLFILEYIIYYLLYLLLKNKNINLFFNLFIIIKFIIIFFLVYTLYNNIIILSLLVMLLIITKFILYLFEKIEQIIILHNNIEQIENDKKMYESLFKITHEIKNPIAVVKGYLDMYDIHNEKHAIKYIPIMKNEINRVLVLLEDFLSIKRLKIEKEVMDISLLIEEVLDNFTPLFESKKIKVNCNLNEFYIEADYNRLKQVFINIIKNSIEAITDNGKIDIDIIIKNKYLYINIVDNGIGMNQEEIEKLNYPFFTTKTNGTGLGVYLSKEIIKKHNGSMNYSSDNGVKVSVKLPYDASLN